MMQESEALYRAMEECDAILLGAGAGLSAAGGISFADERAFARRYPYWYQRGLRSEYQMISFRDWTAEQMWAYYAVHIQAVRYAVPPLALYRELLGILRGRDYFVITSNVDRQFWRNGFPPERLFEAQGSYDWLTCSARCTDEVWAAEPVLNAMLQAIDQENAAIPHALLPVCPYCGASLRLAFRDYPSYWEEKARYDSFLERSQSGALCLIEMGVGFNSPGVIRVPFERITGERERARFFRITVDYPESREEIAYPEIPRPIADKALSIKASAKVVIDDLALLDQGRHPQ